MGHPQRLEPLRQVYMRRAPDSNRIRMVGSDMAVVDRLETPASFALL